MPNVNAPRSRNNSSIHYEVLPVTSPDLLGPIYGVHVGFLELSFSHNMASSCSCSNFRQQWRFCLAEINAKEGESIRQTSHWQ
jgi:hypothetical protein